MVNRLCNQQISLGSPPCHIPEAWPDAGKSRRVSRPKEQSSMRFPRFLPTYLTTVSHGYT